MFALIGCVSRQTEKLPERISFALRQIPLIQEGTTEGSVFKLLGLPKSDEPFKEDSVGSVDSTTAAQYKIGFGNKFLLMCESRNSTHDMEFRQEAGVLMRVKILKQGKSGEYETLKPEWMESDLKHGAKH